MPSKKLSSFIPVFFMVFIGMAGVLVSSVLIETGSYISEQERFGYYNGSTLIYLTWVLFSFLVIYINSLFYKPLDRGLHAHLLKNNRNRFDFLMLRFACVLVICSVLFWGVKSGFPLLNREDRFIYWSTQNNLFKSLYGQFFLISFFLGWLYFSNKVFSVVFFVFILIIHVLFSNKFSAVIFSIFLYFLPWFFFGAASFSFKRYFKVFSFLIVIIIALLYFVYSFIYNVGSPVGFLFKVLDRAVLQGHVFWGTINLHGEFFFFDSGALFKEVLGAFELTDDYYGMKNLMVKVSEEIGEKRIKQGADFTMAYPAVIYNFSGIVGIFIAQLFFLSAFSFLIFFAIHCVKKLYVFCLVPIVKLIIDFIGFFSIGNLDLVFGFKPVFYLLLLFFSYLFYYVLTAEAAQKSQR